jgi:Tfp pilus assembly protein PilN
VRAINLLPKDDARGRQKTQWLVLVPVAAAVLLTGALSVGFLTTSGKVKDRQAELATLKDELAAIPTPNASKVQSQNALASDRGTRIQALSAALSRRVAWDRVFREFSLVLPDDVWLSTLSAKAPQSSSVPTASEAAATPAAPVASTEFTLDGYTYSHAAVARLLTRLAVVPDLVNVQLQQSTLSKIGTAQVVHFVIVADVRSPGGGS